MTEDEPPLDPPRFHSSEVILAHPRFNAGRAAYVESLLSLYEHDPALNRTLTEIVRSLVFFNIVGLHFASDDSDRTTWPTMNLLLSMMRLYGLTSPRRTEDIVNRFTVAGFVEKVPASLDRRVRLVKPTARALAHDRDYLKAYYTGLDVMFPEPGYAAPLAGDPHFQHVHRAVGRGLTAYAARLMGENPPVMFFMMRDAGAMVLLKLMQRIGEGDGVSSGAFSFSDIGARFGVSRTHVRELLRDAEKSDLLQMSEGSVTLSPALAAGFDRFVADTLSGMDLIFRIASRQMKSKTIATTTDHAPLSRA